MSKYYDLDKLKELIEAKAETLIGDGAIAFHAVGKWLDLLPAADVAPVVHARWILRREPDGSPYCFSCSNCDHDTKSGLDFCGRCGARMDEEGEK